MLVEDAGWRDTAQPDERKTREIVHNVTPTLTSSQTEAFDRSDNLSAPAGHRVLSAQRQMAVAAGQASAALC